MRMANNTLTRKEFIAKSVCMTSTFAGSTLWLLGCGTKTEEKKQEAAAPPKDPCSDFSNVTENDLNARKKLGYVKESPIPDSKCGNCQLWLPPKDGKTCGNCQLFKGPVFTTAYCTYWAPQIQG
jgi:hypothetical protein